MVAPQPGKVPGSCLGRCGRRASHCQAGHGAVGALGPSPCMACRVAPSPAEGSGSSWPGSGVCAGSDVSPAPRAKKARKAPSVSAGEDDQQSADEEEDDRKSADEEQSESGDMLVGCDVCGWALCRCTCVFVCAGREGEPEGGGGVLRNSWLQQAGIPGTCCLPSPPEAGPPAQLLTFGTGPARSSALPSFPPCAEASEGSGAEDDEASDGSGSADENEPSNKPAKRTGGLAKRTSTSPAPQKRRGVLVDSDDD